MKNSVCSVMMRPVERSICHKTCLVNGAAIACLGYANNMAGALIAHPGKIPFSESTVAI